MAGVIEFYFDFSSPYGYFALVQVDDPAAEFGRTVTWKPIMIGAAFKESGNSPLIEQPLKGDYSRLDWQRIARLLNVPWVLPEPFPSDPGGRARLLVAGRARRGVGQAIRPGRLPRLICRGMRYLGGRNGGRCSGNPEHRWTSPVRRRSGPGDQGAAEAGDRRRHPSRRLWITLRVCRR